MRRVLTSLCCLILLAAAIPATAQQSGDFSYASDGASITITRYNGNGGFVTIPDTIEGLPVTGIGEGAFAFCPYITRLTLPDGITIIGTRAFQQANLLATTIPDTVARIELEAFSYCRVLGSVTIGNGVTNIGNWAFETCTTLTNITLGNSVTDVGDWAFSGCTGLPAVTVPDTVTSIGSRAFYGCTSLTNVTIGDGVSNIRPGAFSYCTGLTNIMIGTGVTTIGAGAFQGCSGLTNIAIGNSVTSIGVQTFYGCTNLTTIEVDGENPAYSSVEGVLFNQSRTVLVTYPAGRDGPYPIPDGVRSIGYGAFCGCAGLTSVGLPDSLTGIEGEAFSGCTGLANVTLPNRVTYIEWGAFWLCTGLAQVTIPDSVTYIGGSAFYSCANLLSATIPDGVTNIASYTFFMCGNLTNVTIGHGVTRIHEYAFAFCTNLPGLFFEGNAPMSSFEGFGAGTNTTVYYLPGTRGWRSTFDASPTAPWLLPYPVMLTTPPDFGVQTNQFGFIISWATNTSVVVEACTDLTLPDWSPVGTNVLNEGWSYFSDPQWTNYASRFYRIRSP
jgi:hypothetical protein